MKRKSITLLFSLLAWLALTTSARAQYLTNSFTTQDNVTNTPPPGFVLNLSNPTNVVVFTTNGARFLYAGDGNRNYVATSDYTTYDQTSFEASVEVPVAGAFAPFFGLGQGSGVSPFFEPANSIYIRARVTGGPASVIGGAGGSFTAFGGGITAPYTMKIQYDATYRVILFTLIKGAVTNSFGPISLPTLAGSYSLFLGGNNGTTFSNLVISAPTVNLVATNAHFTTPAPTLYVGYPAPKQWVSADYNVGPADMTSDLNTVYSSTDTAVCDVISFGGTLLPVAEGVCQIIATNSALGVAATQTVTVVSAPPAIYLTNSFVGPSATVPPTNMYVSLGRFENKVNFTTNGVAFQGTLGDADRSYLATAYNAYESQDFRFDVDCTTNVAFAAFLGIGRGEIDAAGQEPRNSIWVRLRFSGSQPQLQSHGATIPALPAFNAWPAGFGAGPVHVRMVHTTGSGVVAMTLSTAATNQTVSIPMSSVSACAAPAGKGVRLFIGGSGSATTSVTYTNLAIQNPIGAGVNPTNLYFASAPATLLAGQPTPHQLTVYADFSDGSKSNNVTTYVAPYTSLDPAVFSVSAAGEITAGISGTNNVTADWSGSWGTVSASQEVRVLAPASLSVEVPALFEGGRVADATLRANFTSTITNVNVTGFAGLTWSAPQALGFISVAGNAITPLLQGTEDLTVTYDTLTTTQTVTVLPPAPFYRTDSFIGAPGTPLPSGYYSAKQSAGNPGGVVSPAGALFVNAAPNQRDYIRSAIPYYDQSNWVATVYVKTNAAFASFFGLGRGLGGGASGEPVDSIYIRARNAGGNPNVGGTLFTQWPNGVGEGPIILRMKHEVGTGLWFTIITGDANETIGPIVMPVLAQGYSIFFGGAEIDRAQTYVNLSILPALGVPTTPTLLQTLNGSNLTLTWSDGFLLRATNVIGPWSQVLGANSPYTLVINPTNEQEYFRASMPYVP
ncbi:MAG: hypothetical protein H7Y43_00375 [Akkermansiaceae bacterium]|nr:hypothetical protein [Verrucomicrobiales bacterium]